jgi:hypothetical protein
MAMGEQLHPCNMTNHVKCGERLWGIVENAPAINEWIDILSTLWQL